MRAKKLLLLLLCVSMAATWTLSGCSPAKNTAQEAKTETVTEGNKAAATVEITDQAGRKVTVPTPENLKKVYYPNPIGQMMIYSINPELMAGVCTKFSEEELKYLDPSMKDMPLVGTFQAGQEMDKESILKSGVQAIIYIGPNKLGQETVDTADKLQAQLKIPVLVVSGMFEDMPETYRFLGKLFGEEEKAEKLASYCDDVINNVMSKVSKIPDNKRVSVYYAEGPEGLATEPDTSSHAAVLKYANAYNVADVKGKGGSGMSPVSLEQVLNWNPQVIVGAAATCKYIKNNPDWANIDAVKNDRIYEIPDAPFNWMDRPPSINRFLGVQWMANLLYPDVYNINITEQTKEFYKLFYNVQITDDDAKSIMGNGTKN